MNVDWVIPCRYVEVHANLGTIVGAGIDTFVVGALPGEVQVAMAVRLTAVADEIDAGADHEARSIVTGPGGDVIGDATTTFTVDPAEPLRRRDWLQGILTHTAVQFTAEEPGTYTFEYIVDGSSASVPLHVVAEDDDDDEDEPE